MAESILSFLAKNEREIKNCVETNLRIEKIENLENIIKCLIDDDFLIKDMILKNKGKVFSNDNFKNRPF